jgi:hypothetical protein
MNKKLGQLYEKIFPQQDEGIRNEGPLHTTITILAGLLHFPDFREKMSARYNVLNGFSYLEEEKTSNNCIIS